MTATPPAQVAETHISTVMLIGDRAYKLLKPVTTEFLDHSTRQARYEAAVREVELNRRFAPDVYLGVSDITENGRTVDHMIVMRRMPDDRRLAQLVGDPSSAGHVRAVARAVAVIHSELPPLDNPERYASRDIVEARWLTEFDEMERFADTVIPRTDLDRARTLALRYVANRGELFARRIRDGMIKDGHGDLLTEDIFCLDDGPRILDCLAFDDDLRRGDVLADTAFLAMDLERISGATTAAAFMSAYQEFSAEHHAASLAHHYVAARAMVRAKVAGLCWEQGQPGAAERARGNMALCLRHLERGDVRLVVVGGLPGTGKSTVATAIADAMNWTLLGSDELRKDLAQVQHDVDQHAAPGTGIYDDEWNDRTYEELIRRAGRLLVNGESVVIDASWGDSAQRERLRAAAAELDAPLTEVRCVLESSTARERIVRRMASAFDPSDATPEIFDHLAARFDPWPEAAELDTSHSMAETADRAVRIACGDLRTA